MTVGNAGYSAENDQELNFENKVFFFFFKLCAKRRKFEFRNVKENILFSMGKSSLLVLFGPFREEHVMELERWID